MAESCTRPDSIAFMVEMMPDGDGMVAAVPRRARYFDVLSECLTCWARVRIELSIEAREPAFGRDRCEAPRGPRVEIPERGVR